MAVTINDVIENYGFLRGNEAKQIFLDLEKIEFVKREEILYDEELVEWADSLLSYNKEKVQLVNRFLAICWLIQKGKNSSEKFDNEKERLLIKANFDPYYVYEVWLVEKEKMFDKMKVASYLDDDFFMIGFLEKYKA